METMTIPALQQMKRDGKKSVGVVAWDTQMALIAERAGVDFISVGDSVGVNLWGHDNPLEVTLDEILICCKAVIPSITGIITSSKIRSKFSFSNASSACCPSPTMRTVWPKRPSIKETTF